MRQHSVAPLALPCRLLIPDRGTLPGPEGRSGSAWGRPRGVGTRRASLGKIRPEPPCRHALWGPAPNSSPRSGKKRWPAAPAASGHARMSRLCEKFPWSQDSVAPRFKMPGPRDLPGQSHLNFIILQNQQNVDMVDVRCWMN